MFYLRLMISVIERMDQWTTEQDRYYIEKCSHSLWSVPKHLTKSFLNSIEVIRELGPVLAQNFRDLMNSSYCNLQLCMLLLLTSSFFIVVQYLVMKL